MTEALQRAIAEAATRLSPPEQDALAQVLLNRLATRPNSNADVIESAVAREPTPENGAPIAAGAALTDLTGQDGEEQLQQERHFVSTIIDNAGVLIMEEALKRSEERSARTEEITHLGSWDLDLTTGMLYWSDEVYRICGLKPRSFQPTYETLAQVVHPDDYQGLIDAINGSLAGEHIPYSYEHRVVRPDGELRFVHEQGQVYRDDRGQPVRMIGSAHDVTERRQAEDAIRQNRRLLQELLDGITESVFLMDLKGTVLAANKTIAQRMGVTVSELVGSCIYDFLPPAVAQHRREIMGKIIQEGLAFHFADTNNGQRLESYVYPIRRSGREIDALAVFGMDITERKRLEEELRQSEIRYQELFRKIPIPTYTWRRQGEDFVLVAYNEAASLITDGKIASLVGVRLQDLYADSSEMLRDFLTCIEDQTVVRREMVYNLKSSGAQKHLWVYYAFVPPDTVMVHTEDISERKRAEIRQASLARIIENSRNEIYIFDAETLRFAEVNRAARDNLGYSMEELSCLTPLDLKPTYTPETFSALVQPLRTGTKSKIEFTTVHRRKDGSLYPVEVHLQLGVYETRPAFIAIILDITEQKRIETQLRESLQEKETLLREIHHRVKNNLQIISSLLYFQAKQVKDPESAKVFLEGQNRLRAMILVHEQLYRAENLSRIDFASYVRSLVQQLAQSHGDFQQKFHLSVDSDEVQLPIEIALPCGMILNELLINIFKYAYPNGRSGAAIVKVTRRDTGIQLQVTDDGVGLPASVDVSTPTTFGMQLINNLAAQVKGTVQYEQDHGTKVTVTVNLSPEGTAQA
jgi:hypothetical protein